MGTLFGEPVMMLVAGGGTLVQAFMQLLIEFGVHITGGQQAAITTFVAVIIGLITRTQVTPIATLPAGVAGQIANAAALPKAPIPPTKAAMLFVLLACGLVLGSASACIHPPSTIVTAQGQTAYTADQIALRINELENAAIASGLPTNTIRAIVTFCVDADHTLGATPSGWLATITQAWTGVKASLPTTTNAAVIAAMAAVDVVLGTLAPAAPAPGGAQ